MEPVRWGILSTALIGTAKVIPAMRKSQALTVAAIASRGLPKAQAAAAELGIPKAYGSYEALLADPSIEAIYNPLPNHLHVELTLAAAKAGKHVLCEKPFSMHAADLDVLRPFAAKVHIREAFMVRFHPQWLAVREEVRSGVIGELRYMQVPFSYFNADPANIRNIADIGGGALYDIGCYAITAGRWFFEREPERVVAAVDRTRPSRPTAAPAVCWTSGQAATWCSPCPHNQHATSVCNWSARRAASRSRSRSTRRKTEAAAIGSTMRARPTVQACAP